MSKKQADLVEVFKPCPVCGEEGEAQINTEENTMGEDVDIDFTGSWKCDNDDCERDYFVSSSVQFYAPVMNSELDNWTWTEVKQEYNI
jgi:hypothetical protein